MKKVVVISPGGKIILTDLKDDSRTMANELKTKGSNNSPIVTMNTIEMLKDWSERGFKNSYVMVDGPDKTKVGRIYESIEEREDHDRSKFLAFKGFGKNEILEISDPLETLWVRIEEEKLNPMTFQEAMDCMQKEKCACYNNYDYKTYELMTRGQKNGNFIVRVEGNRVITLEVSIGLVFAEWYRK